MTPPRMLQTEWAFLSLSIHDDMNRSEETRWLKHRHVDRETDFFSPDNNEQLHVEDVSIAFFFAFHRILCALLFALGYHDNIIMQSNKNELNAYGLICQTNT